MVSHDHDIWRHITFDQLQPLWTYIENFIDKFNGGSVVKCFP